MGEAMVKARASKFTHQQNEAYNAEFEERSLFHERREVYATDYACRPLDDKLAVRQGEEVIVRRTSRTVKSDENAAPTVEVLLGNQVVAVIDGDGGKLLLDIIESDPRCAGCFSASIVSTSPLDGYFSIRCVNAEDTHGSD